MPVRRLSLILVFICVLSTLGLSHTFAQNNQSHLREPDSGEGTSEKYLTILKSPETQYVTRGDNAVFTVAVFNTSDKFAMLNVSVVDALTPDCELELPSLSAEQDISYTCTHENVQSRLKNEVAVSGENATTGQKNKNSATATVEIVELTAELSPDPASLLAPGGQVQFNVIISNTGSVATQLTTLTSTQLGDLTDTANVNLTANTCASRKLPNLAPNGDYKCSFEADVTGEPGDYSFEIAAGGQVNDGPAVTGAGSTIVTIYQLLSASLIPSIERALAGSELDLTVEIANASVDDTITITGLEDEILGDLEEHGNCLLPQILSSGESYSCQYQQSVEGETNEILSYSVDITAEVDEKPPTVITYTASAEVLIIKPTIHLPYILTVPRPTTCTTAFNVETNRPYQFYTQTTNAFYRFILEEEADVTIRLTDFVTSDGQLQVLNEPGEQCQGLQRIRYVPNTSPDMMVNIGTLQPGTYYAFIVNADDPPAKSPYTLFIETK